MGLIKLNENGTELTTLFRVENPTTNIGLWYAQNGVRTDYIKTIPDAKNADLPMDFDTEVAGGWMSACTDFDQLKEWFSVEDLKVLGTHGYELFRIETTLSKAYNGHMVFRKEQSLLIPIPLDSLFY